MATTLTNNPARREAAFQWEIDLTAKLDELVEPLASVSAPAKPTRTAQPARTAPSAMRTLKKRRGRRRKLMPLQDSDVFDPVRCDFPALVELLDEVTEHRTRSR